MADGNLYMNGVLSDLYDLEKKIDPENLGDEYCWQTDELLAAIEKIRAMAEEIRQLRAGPVQTREKILRDGLEEAQLILMKCGPIREALAVMEKVVEQADAAKEPSEEDRRRIELMDIFTERRFFTPGESDDFFQLFEPGKDTITATETMDLMNQWKYDQLKKRMGIE